VHEFQQYNSSVNNKHFGELNNSDRMTCVVYLLQVDRLVTDLKHSENQQNSGIYHCEKLLSAAFGWCRWASVL